MIMFTGIIEEIGILKELKKSAQGALVVVECKNVIQDVKLGDSIAINGICQTVVSFNNNSFSAQVSPQTLDVTTFSSIKPNDKVNLERALTLSQRLGGHIVTGHVDCIGKILSVEKLSDFYTLRFKVENNFRKYLADKGSVCINGISLTVAQTFSDEFKVAIIPHTFENTNLKDLKIGDFVNLEFDILAKYVEKILLTNNNKVIDENFLKENGFF